MRRRTLLIALAWTPVMFAFSGLLRFAAAAAGAFELDTFDSSAFGAQ